MKKTTTTLASLVTAASATAHTSGIPHDHSGMEWNWQALIIAAVAITFAAGAVTAIRKKSASAK